MTGRIRRIDKMLRDGRARIICRVSLSTRWPDPPFAYAIDDLDRQKTIHVRLDEAPARWAKLPGATAELSE